MFLYEESRLLPLLPSHIFSREEDIVELWFRFECAIRNYPTIDQLEEYTELAGRTLTEQLSGLIVRNQQSVSGQ